MAETPGMWLASDLAARLSSVLESMTGEAPSVTHAAHVPPELTPEDGLCWEQPLSLSPEATIWIAASPAAWNTIGGQVLKAAGVDEVDAESARGTYLEIVSQVLSGIASTLSARAGIEVSCEAGREAPPTNTAGLASYAFTVNFPDLAAQIVASFHPFLANLPEQAEAADAEPLLANQPAPPIASPPRANSIDLLLDVELPVSISFGRAQLPLKDVIKLTTGSIVELNRSVSEPVEVIVNNCVIARGEVVVVEGNFGIRIKQVISRQERLRTLH